MNYNCMLELGFRSYEMEVGFCDIFTSYEMELETHVHVWYGMVCRTSMVWYDFSVLWYMYVMVC